MNPLRTITAIIGVSESLAANWPMYEQVEAALLPSPLRGTSYDNDGGHGTDTPDPTGSLATQLTASGHGIHNLADTVECLEATLAQLRWAQTRVNTLIRQHPDLARDIEATRAALLCDGTYDPLCKGNVYKAGKCKQCFNNDAKAKQRARDRRTPVDTTFVPLRMNPIADCRSTCLMCEAVFVGDDASHVQALLDAHACQTVEGLTGQPTWG